MPSLIDIRRRVRAVKSTQQITKAMKMIAASRLRRAQDRIVHARPYAQQMQRVLTSVAARVDANAHPLLTQPDPSASGRSLLIIITADRGLCGSFNTNVIKAAGHFLRAHAGQAVSLGLVGRKGRDFFRRRGLEVRYEQIGLFSNLKFADAQAIARTAIDAFIAGDVRDVYLVYNEFKSVMSQNVVIERLLPIARLDEGTASGSAAAGSAATGSVVSGPATQAPQIDYLYEPEPAQILDDLLPRHVEIQVYRALLESAAAEHAARMTAMDTASRNSADMIESLTLYMNKVRQAAITREIIEVVSGAQAL
jgi:F-type H+-transporting ATPase subunit gamma